MLGRETWRFMKVKRHKCVGHSSLGWVSQVRNLGLWHHPSPFSLCHAISSLEGEMQKGGNAFTLKLSLPLRAFEFSGELLEPFLRCLRNHHSSGGLGGRLDWTGSQKRVVTALHWNIICQYTGKTGSCLYKRGWKHCILFCCLWCVFLWLYSGGDDKKTAQGFLCPEGRGIWGKLFSKTRLLMDPHAWEGRGSLGDIWATYKQRTLIERCVVQWNTIN